LITHPISLEPRYEDPEYLSNRSRTAKELNLAAEDEISRNAFGHSLKIKIQRRTDVPLELGALSGRRHSPSGVTSDRGYQQPVPRTTGNREDQEQQEEGITTGAYRHHQGVDIDESLFRRTRKQSLEDDDSDTRRVLT
jgi:hypothetical protein